MPRKKKKGSITIDSRETKIVFALILLPVGLAVLISPFMSTHSPLFATVALLLGYTAIVWGILLLYLSISFFFKSKKILTSKQIIGLILFALSLGVLLSFWLIEEQLADPEALITAGGQLGKILHVALNDFFGNLIEILLILILLIVSFSLITGTALSQIADFLESSLPDKEKKEGFDLKSFLKKFSSDDITTKDDIKIHTGEEEEKGETEEEMQKRLDDILEKEEAVAPIPETQPNLETSAGDITTTISTINPEEDLKPKKPIYTNWTFPPLDLLQEPIIHKQDKNLYRSKAMIIERTLKTFGIQAKVAQVSVGPTVLRFALSVSMGVKVSRIKSLSNDLALALASQTSSVRIEAPIPGTSFVGIEIPNPTPNFVYTKDLITKLTKEKDKYELPLIVGKDITARTCIRDLAKIPHLLVAGATGTGKSVAINSLLTGLLMTKSPDEVKFIMIDPKMGVEMTVYNGIPHLLNPVITDSDAVTSALQWCIDEMMRRYRQLKQVGAKKITEYNSRVGYLAMPYIIVVVDEMADLMLSTGIDVEARIQRLAQMGRAVGVHLILATQKPTVNVITGLIKANVPGRMAFAVATGIDSRVILDETGAETLLGNGDMLYKDQTTPKALRVQGTFTETKDSENIIKAIKEQVKDREIEYSEGLKDAIEKGPTEEIGTKQKEKDPEFNKALAVVIATQKASASFLQRKMKIGYNKAARLIDELQEAGAIGPEKGSKPRDVLVTSVSQLSPAIPDDERAQ